MPLDIDGDDLPLRHEPAVAPLLTALRVAARAALGQQDAEAAFVDDSIGGDFLGEDSFGDDSFGDDSCGGDSFGDAASGDATSGGAEAGAAASEDAAFVEVAPEDAPSAGGASEDAPTDEVAPEDAVFVEAAPEAAPTTEAVPGDAARPVLDAETALDLLTSPWAEWTPPICGGWAGPCARRNGPPGRRCRGPPTS